MSDDRLQALERMVAARPSDPRLRFGLAVELLNQGRTREGAEALEAYLAVAQDQGNAWSRLGAALAELGEVERAREAYGQGLEVARRFGHDSMVEEMEEGLENLS